MFKIIYDPTNHWAEKGIQVTHIIERTRMPVLWSANVDWHKTLLERIKAMYQFGWNPMEGFEHDVLTGIMYYPGDPPLYPLVYIQNGPDENHDHLWFYNHDWISIMSPNAEGYETVRID